MLRSRRQKPAYTTEEYNAYIKAHDETDPQQKIKLLDDFVAKYPNSALLDLHLQRLLPDLLRAEGLSEHDQVH